MAQIKLGTSVRVSDPCYTDDVWCKTKLTNVKAGDYQVKVERADLSGWGNRISKLQVVHIDHTGISHDDFNWEEHSEIGVDSGQAGIFCESSYRNDEIAKDIVTPESNFTLGDFRKESEDGEVFYEKMCKFTLTEQWGVYETGVVTSSGIGDGGYPLDVLQLEDGTIVGMRITYLFPEDEDEDGEICGDCGGDMEDGECEYCQHELSNK
jgi:hypothetical protein